MFADVKLQYTVKGLKIKLLLYFVHFLKAMYVLHILPISIRLPIVQGSTFSYLVPTFAILSLPDFQCPEEMENGKFHVFCFSECNNDFIENIHIFNLIHRS